MSIAYNKAVYELNLKQTVVRLIGVGKGGKRRKCLIYWSVKVAIEGTFLWSFSAKLIAFYSPRSE